MGGKGVGGLIALLGLAYVLSKPSKPVRARAYVPRMGDVFSGVVTKTALALEDVHEPLSPEITAISLTGVIVPEFTGVSRVRRRRRRTVLDIVTVNGNGVDDIVEDVSPIVVEALPPIIGGSGVRAGLGHGVG